MTPSPRARRTALAGLAAVLAATTIASCDIAVEPKAPLVPAGMSPVARRFVDEFLGLLQARSIRRAAIDWVAFRAQVLQQAPFAQTIEDTHPIIQHALVTLADGHSTFRTSNGRFFYFPLRTCVRSNAAPPASLPADVGYVRVGTFAGGGPGGVAFADSIQAVIRAADRDGLSGWIVDLRGNGGGNMWPMLAALSPIIGDDLLGHFVDPDGTVTAWDLRDGAARLAGVVQQVATSPYRLKRERPRVAVLTDNGVASSGEAVAIAFRGRANARSFGVATCGQSTANAAFVLSDGSLLNLTVATMADRTRRAYGGQVAPDETVPDVVDEVVRRAVAWLQQPGS